MKAVVRQFGEVRALDGIDLEIQSGEFFSLLGPSGCGKTTLLRIIAGLDYPDQGELEICGSNAEGIPAHRRPVNTVFQSYALFPHLDVWHNIAFGLRMKSVPVHEQETRVRQVMEMVQITPLAHRRTAQLSGGQKQRVALARAIVNEPKVLLLDEPLGALDLKLRKELQVELHQLQRRLGITFIYVTHDQEEALTMSDRIAVMNCGRIEQMDRSAELYERPNTRFVAQFLGSCNLIQATTLDRGLTGLWLESEVGRLRLTSVMELTPLEKRGQLTLAIRPEKIQLLTASKPPVENTITVRIEDIIYSGAETQYLLKAGPIPLRVCCLNARAGASQFFEGQIVKAVLPASELVVLED